MGLYSEALRKIQTGHKRYAITDTWKTQPVSLPNIPRGMADDIRRLQERIDYLLPNRPSRVVGLCGVDRGVGNTTIAYMLSLQYARIGYPFFCHGVNQWVDRRPMGMRKTHHLLLLDANLHAPGLHVFFGRRRETGLVDIIEQDLPWSEAASWIQPGEFALITAGRTPDAATHIFKSSRLPQFIRRAREIFYTIIIDFAAVLHHPDLMALGESLDGVVLVAAARSSRVEALQKTRALLDEKGIKILGVVLNRM